MPKCTKCGNVLKPKTLGFICKACARTALQIPPAPAKVKPFLYFQDLHGNFLSYKRHCGGLKGLLFCVWWDETLQTIAEINTIKKVVKPYSNDKRVGQVKAHLKSRNIYFRGILEGGT